MGNEVERLAGVSRMLLLLTPLCGAALLFVILGLGISSERFAERNFEVQQGLRYVLKTNLIVQKGMDDGLAAIFRGDADAMAEAALLIESAAGFLHPLENWDTGNPVDVEGDILALADSFDSISKNYIALGRDVPLEEVEVLTERAKKIYSLLVRSDTLQYGLAGEQRIALKNQTRNSYFAIFLLAALIGIMVEMLRRTLSKHLLAEKKLRQAHESLEKRVEERTIELGQAYTKLQLEVKERLQAEKERREMERQVHHAQKLESLGVLAGGIAHDFNNILMGVLGNAELARMSMSPENPVKDYIEKIESSALRAAELAKQMLAYSGKGSFIIEQININRMVEEMTHLLNTAISKTAVLKLNLSEPIPPINGDVTQVRQVFMNLITNASEAIGDQRGVITVSTGVMELPKEYLESSFANEDVNEGCYTFIEVNDTGCGMDKETQGKIFDPFFTTKFTGRGLGLAATLGIIRGHNGAIKVYSEPGQGTSIKVLFPCGEEHGKGVVTADETPSSVKQWQEQGTILVVDDEETVRELAKQILEEHGFSVLLAEDGREALKVFKESAENISMVLLDMTMPHMGGEETFTEIRKVKPDVMVVLSSGYNEQDATMRFAGKGLAGFIQKPYKPSEFIEKLHALFGKETT